MEETQQLKKKLFNVTRDFIQELDPESFQQEKWIIAVNYFKERFDKRYFNQLHILINNVNNEIRNNCGFIVTTLDCVLIETLEQFYVGNNESENIDEAFFSFFQRN